MTSCRVEACAEESIGTVDVDPVTDSDRIVQVSRDHSPGHALDRDGEDVRAEGCRGDRIAALTSELGEAHRHVLTGGEVDSGHPPRPQLEGSSASWVT